MVGSGKKERIALELARLRERSRSDFVAFALPAEHYRLMRWDFVIGSRNERVGQMKLFPGIGMGGMVLRHGTQYTVNETENQGMLAECPVMLAERLASGMAFPIPVKSSGSLNGILLLGRRGSSKYEELEIQGLSASLNQIIEGE